MKSQLVFSMRKKQIFGLFAFALLISSLQLVLYFLKRNETPNNSPVHFTTSTIDKPEIFLTEFNPNALSKEDWQKLGFSEKQAASILKYKSILDGNFSSLEEIQKCFVISDEKFEEIKPFIRLENYTNHNGKSNVEFKSNYHSKGLKINQKFNPNSYVENDWVKIGFSEKQAESILKYKKFLGGSFSSKEEIQKCFVISDENYNQLAPFLLLPETKTIQKFASTTPKSQLKPFDPNANSKEDWIALGFSEKQAQTILNYKLKVLKGSFKSTEDLKKCYAISPEKFAEIQPYIRIQNPDNTIQILINQETDYSKLDINSITYKQLIEYGFDEKAAGSLVGFRKKLGGFVTKNQVLETYNIDKELTSKLLATIQLDPTGITKYDLVTAPEDWLKNHPYFKYSADKIIYYRTTYPDEKKIWKFLKLKPEYETRMKLYLK